MSPAIDRDVLTAMRDSVPHGAKIVTRVMKAWLRDAPTRLEQIRDAVHSGDVETAHRAVHSLKSASATIGANVMATYCRSAEVSFAQGTLDDGLVSEIERHYQQARDEIVEMLDAEI